MEDKCICKICGKVVSNNNSYIGSHVKRIHGLELNQYVEQYYKNLTPEIGPEKCGFCNNLAKPHYIIDNSAHTFQKNYEHGFLCGVVDCRDQISQTFLGEVYSKKKYEHIGAKAEYLAQLYKIELNTAKQLKTDPGRVVLDKSKSNLDGFILRYGEEQGRIKYQERSSKIAKANTKLWYLEKFGEIEGNQRWSHYIQKVKENTLGMTKSKSSQRILKLLQELNLKVEDEKFIYEDKLKAVDFYLPDQNVVVEYFGDYWHMNPRLYEKNFFNKTLKVTAEEVWAKDQRRNQEIMDNIKDCSLIIIWETTKIDAAYLSSLIKNVKNKKIIVYL